MSILIGVLTAVHVLIALFLIVLVLMQKSQDQGVGAAFGGGVTETMFGGGATTALMRMTIWCACGLLATTLILAVLIGRGGRTGTSLMKRSMREQPAAAVPASPLPEAPSGTPAPAPSPAAPAAPAPAP